VVDERFPAISGNRTTLFPFEVVVEDGKFRAAVSFRSETETEQALQQMVLKAVMKALDQASDDNVFTSRSVAALLENDLANRRLPMLCLITTLGGTIAAGCSRCQSRLNYEFAMDRPHRHPHRRANMDGPPSRNHFQRLVAWACSESGGS